jgi:hypothetical protein
MGVLLSAKGQRRELERQYSEDKGRTRRSKTVEATTNNSIQRAELTLEFEILIEL